jgi:hypothetical protein
MPRGVARNRLTITNFHNLFANLAISLSIPKPFRQFHRMFDRFHKIFGYLAKSNFAVSRKRFVD